MIHTYEQKLIWTDFQGMTTLIGKLEPFSGDAYQSSPNLKNLIKKKTLFMDHREVVCDTYI